MALRPLRWFWLQASMRCILSRLTYAVVKVLAEHTVRITLTDEREMLSSASIQPGWE